MRLKYGSGKDTRRESAAQCTKNKRVGWWRGLEATNGKTKKKPGIPGRIGVTEELHGVRAG